MQMSKLWRGALVAGAFIVTSWAEDSTPAAIVTSSGLEVVTSAERRFVAEGKDVSEFVPAGDLRIGDEIFYTMRVRNAANEAVANPVVVKAIPRNTRYIIDSAVGPAARITFSIDGGTTFLAVDELTIPSPNGDRRATPDEFTHIRWQLRHPLEPGATALLRFRGIFR